MRARTIVCATCVAIAGIACAIQLQAQPGPPDCNIGRVDPPKTDPRHPYMHCFMPWGEMRGWLTTCVNPAKEEGFGSRVVALGDINHDNIADFAVERTRCDADTTETLRAPIEWYVYHGVRNGLPDARSGQRIGPTEIYSETTVLCSGDWDNDGNRDLAARIEVFNDTASGNSGHNTRTSDLVIFWGAASGTFTIEDTIRLSCGYDKWLGIFKGLAIDLDRDGINELVISTSGLGYQNRIKPAISLLQIFKGERVKGNREKVATIGWSNVPPFNDIKITDQDCDGNADIALINQRRSNIASDVSVLYGRREALPDTNEVETVNLTAADGHYTLFIDVTGDRVPELVSNSNEEMITVFAGRPGQRLREQYGSGDEPGRPYLKVPLPKKVNPDDWFSSGEEPLYDLGDGNLDGIDDVWTYSFPFFSCYVTGIGFDRFIDGGMRWGAVVNATRLGDIDGSGVASFAVSYYGTPGGFALYKATDSLPPTAEWITLPHPESFKCSVAASVPERELDSSSLIVLPNPSRGELTLRWNNLPVTGTIIVTIVATGGSEALSMNVPSGQQDVTIATRVLSAGAYLAIVRSGDRSISTKIIIE